ncbi:MAG: hypothetical protein ACXVW7_20295 [Trebonia sp.]
MDNYDAWDIMPVVNPSLPANRRQRMIRRSKMTTPVGRPAPMRQVLHRDEVVGPLALDRPCRHLLRRVQRSITRVLRSGVYAADLRTTVPESVLRRHEWEIAFALRDITELRVEYASSASAAGPGPMTAAVLASQRRALTLAQEAVASRASALERYAAQVEAADAAQRDWQDAIRVAGLNDKYLDLVARTAADQHAVAEITKLTEQAAVAAQVFDDSLQQVTLAAEALALPPEK